MPKLPGIVVMLVFVLGLPVRNALAADATGPAPVVYLADFELNAADVAPATGPRARVGQLFGNVLPHGPLHHESDPATRAAQIVALMTQTLQADLQKAGVEARVLPAGAALPPSGWLVRGVFLSADEGNRLRRAVIGLHSGQAQLQVAVAIDTLSGNSTPAPLYNLTESEASTPVPGAIVTLNPYVAATKFALDAHDLDAEVKRTAQKIADQVSKRLH